VFRKPGRYNVHAVRAGYQAVSGRTTGCSGGDRLALLVFAAVVGVSSIAVAAAYVLTGIGISRVSASPRGGAVAELGEPLLIDVVLTGLGAVSSELLVGGVPVDAEVIPREGDVTEWSVTHTWQAEEPGQYRLSVLVTDILHRSLESSPVTVAVVPPGRVVLSSNRTGNYEIHSMRTDGSEVVHLTSEEGQKREPCCGPGQAVLLTAFLDRKGSDIWLMDSPSGAGRWLTSSLGGDRWARWAPDGKSIVFVSDRYGSSQLFLVDPDGRRQTQLTREDFPVEYPSWSPDGSTLAIAANERGNWDIFTFSLSDGRMGRLTEDPGWDGQPAWSPCGSEIAFVSDREGTQQIYLMRADGSEQRRITGFPRGAEHPSWSPDGDWILCVAYTGEGGGLDSREIYLMRSDGTDPTRLTDNAVDDTEPAWCE